MASDDAIDDAFWPQSANPPQSFDKIYKQPGSGLNRLKQCIRILKLHPGAFDDPIECTLQAVRLDDGVEYEALSYAWGDANATSVVLVNGVEFSVTSNLKDFLQRLRLPDRQRSLWADAICIDQTSFEEKISHLMLMDRVYREAKQVHIWLGHFTSSWENELVRNDIESAEWAKKKAKSYWPGMDVHLRPSLHKSFVNAALPLPNVTAEWEEILEGTSPLDQVGLLLDALVEDSHLHDLPFYNIKGDRQMTPGTEADGDHDELTEDADADAEAVEYAMAWLTVVRALLWLLSRPWWKRVWTIQECVIPAEPIIYVGTWTLSLSRLLSALSNAQKHHKTCCKAFKSVWLGEYVETFHDIFQRTEVLREMRQKCRKDEDHRLDVWEVFIESSLRQATDVRDHVYGVLGLCCRPTAMLCEHQSYRLTPLELFMQTTKLLIYPAGLSHFLSLASGNRADSLPGLPSWALDFRNFGHNAYHFCIAIPGMDTGLGKVPYYENQQLMDIWSPTLPVQGYRLDAIDTCAKIIPKCFGDGELSSRQIKTFVEEALDIFCMVNDDAFDLDEDVFWRTVFQRSASESPDEPASMALLKSWWYDHFSTYQPPPPPKKRKRDPSPNTVAAEEGWSPGDEWRDTPAHWHDLHANMANMVFALWKQGRFFCAERGRPGLGPADIEPGDEIYLLASFRGLAILRPYDRPAGSGASAGSDDGSPSDDKPAFTFRGTCYMDGFMEGEVMPSVEQLKDLVLY